MSLVLVTGGAGFIGSHVVDELVARGHEVRVVDSLDATAHAVTPDYLRDDVDYVIGDLRDPDVVRAAVRDVSAVSHQAGRVGLGVDFGDVREYVTANAGGTANLLWALHEAGFGGRFVLGSSMVVYGEGRYVCATHGATRPGPRDPAALRAGDFEPPCPGCGASLTAVAVHEDAPTDPRNVYAATKLHQEHLCAAFGREHDAAVVVLRYHNVYGPRMPSDTPYAGVASIFRSAVAAGRPPQVFEDGRQRRDFVHVGDVARANVLAVEGTVTGVFNVASGTPRTVLDLAAALCRAARDDVPPPAVSGRFRLGDVRHVFAGTDRAREVLGFEACVPFEDGLAEFARAPLREPVRSRA